MLHAYQKWYANATPLSAHGSIDEVESPAISSSARLLAPDRAKRANSSAPFLLDHPCLPGSPPGGYPSTMKQPVVCRNPEIMGGTPVFCGTRVPVQTLLDYLEAGDTIGEFLARFPSVTRQQVIAFLEQAKDRLVESVG
jgi:uncharacterized protein (DUF433 family)